MARNTQEIINDHLAKRKAGKVDEDIAKNFSPQVVLLTGTGVFKGHQGVQDSSAELRSYAGDQATFSYKKVLVEGDYAFLEWTATNPDGREVRDGADSFVVKNGKIVAQTIHYSVHKE